MESYAEIYTALKTSIGAYNKAFARHDLDERLQEFTKREHIWQPGEGAFDPITLGKMYHSFKSLNKQHIIVEDEFFETKRELNLDSLTMTEFVEEIGGKDYYIYPVDKSILFSAEWDSFCYLICSSSNFLDKIVFDFSFEGFYATDSTMHGWEHEGDE